MIGKHSLANSRLFSALVLGVCLGALVGSLASWIVFEIRHYNKELPTALMFDLMRDRTRALSEISEVVLVDGRVASYLNSKEDVEYFMRHHADLFGRPRYGLAAYALDVEAVLASQESDEPYIIVYDPGLDYQLIAQHEFPMFGTVGPCYVRHVLLSDGQILSHSKLSYLVKNGYVKIADVPVNALFDFCGIDQ